MNRDKETSAASPWGTFISFRDRVSSTEFAKGARYRARLKLAKGLRNLPLSDVSEATTESYFVLLKLSLAYSALEALESLVGRGSIQVIDDRFHSALELGQFDRLVKHLVAAAKDQPRATDAELRAFCGSPIPKDLRPLVKHARHVVFHASVTPYSLKLQGSPERRKMILGLANATLDACEQSFTRYVQRVKQRPKQ